MRHPASDQSDDGSEVSRPGVAFGRIADERIRMARSWLMVLRALLTCALVLLAATGSAQAATFVVTTAGDNGDNINPVAGSLRKAILDANATPGADVIKFAIGTVGTSQMIQPVSALPAVSDAVTIDARSQAGAGYSGPPLIVLDGTDAGSTTDGLEIDATGSTVDWLGIQNFTGDGIKVSTSGGDTIFGNTITGNGGLGIDDSGNGDFFLTGPSTRIR